MTKLLQISFKMIFQIQYSQVGDVLIGFIFTEIIEITEVTEK